MESVEFVDIAMSIVEHYRIFSVCVVIENRWLVSEMTFQKASRNVAVVFCSSCHFPAISNSTAPDLFTMTQNSSVRSCSSNETLHLVRVHLRRRVDRLPSLGTWLICTVLLHIYIRLPHHYWGPVIPAERHSYFSIFRLENCCWHHAVL